MAQCGAMVQAHRYDGGGECVSVAERPEHPILRPVAERWLCRTCGSVLGNLLDGWDVE